MKILLDLNGTLVEVAGRRGELYVKGSTWLFLPGAMKAVELLQGCKIPVAIVTNQPGAHRDPRTTETDARTFRADVHAFVHSVAGYLKIPSDELYICDHDYRQQCNCRKPNPALLTAASRGFTDVWMIGDSWKDIVAAETAGIRSCKVGVFGYAPEDEAAPEPDLYVPDVLSAVRMLTGGPF